MTISSVLSGGGTPGTGGGSVAAGPGIVSGSAAAPMGGMVAGGLAGGSGSGYRKDYLTADNFGEADPRSGPDNTY